MNTTTRQCLAVCVVAWILSACDRETTAWCGDECRVDVTPTDSKHQIGEEMVFDVALWTTRARHVYLYADPLCSFRLSVRTEFREQSLRACQDSGSWLFARKDRIGTVESHDGRHFVSYKESEPVKVRLAPDWRLTFQLKAKTGTDSDGNVMLWFAEDVYFSFAPEQHFRFWFTPVESLTNSEPGMFSSKDAFEFEVTTIDGIEHLSITKH